MATDESKVEEIFFCALEKGSAEELAAYLDEACEGDSTTTSNNQSDPRGRHPDSIDSSSVFGCRYVHGVSVDGDVLGC